jgi:hypothetical protein
MDAPTEGEVYLKCRPCAPDNIHVFISESLSSHRSRHPAVVIGRENLVWGPRIHYVHIQRRVVFIANSTLEESTGTAISEQ